MTINRSSIGQQIMKPPMKKSKVVKKANGNLKGYRKGGTISKSSTVVRKKGK